MNYEFILNQDQDQADTTLILSFVCYLINNDIIIKGILFIYFFFFKIIWLEIIFQLQSNHLYNLIFSLLKLMEAGSLNVPKPLK